MGVGDLVGARHPGVRRAPGRETAQMSRDSNSRSVGIVPRLTMVSAVAVFGATALAQDPLAGPQIRIDISGGLAAANETTGSASEMAPNRIVGGWNDYRVPGFVRSGFSLSVDAVGRRDQLRR